MPDEIVRDIYRIEIPLPANPLKALNSYVIKGHARHLVVDCGMRRKECREVMLSGLHELDIDLTKTDFFITHFHADHLGLVSDLATAGATIYLNRPDAVRIMDPNLREAFARLARQHGFPVEEIDSALKAHPGSKYGPQLPLPFSMPHDGQLISAGQYNFRCIATPGHSFGHLCLFEEKEKVLIAGDHLLEDITPNISTWFDDWDPLTQYLKSLNRVTALDVKLILPGHRRIFTDMRSRIEELKEHHMTRADEVLAALEQGPRTAYQLASEMTWDIVCDSFDLFPVSQKWFATGEAIAHLIYLAGIGKVQKNQTSENKFVWTRLVR